MNPAHRYRHCLWELNDIKIISYSSVVLAYILSFVFFNYCKQYKPTVFHLAFSMGALL